MATKLTSTSTTVKCKSMQENVEDQGKKNILLGCSGSVASIKIPLLVKKLLDCKCFNVKVVATEHARHFFNSDHLHGVPLITEADEWKSWKKREDPVVHVNLTKWADLLVIAPLDANSMAKVAAGVCDNLLTCVVRAWDTTKPLLFSPAMNTQMYTHPITASQIRTLTSWGYVEIPVISKVLICGDEGIGAMAELDTIVENVIIYTTQTS